MAATPGAKDWRPILMSAVVYRDPKARLEVPEAAFGFELFMLIEDGDGNSVHSEMRFGDCGHHGRLRVERTPTRARPPSRAKVTQSVAIKIEGDIHAHCARRGRRAWRF